MLIPLQDVLKPYQNLRLQHRGFVVRVDDPLNLGRIKCKVEGLIESDDIDRLPWCFPKEPTTRGGRTDSGVTAVPPLYSAVLIEFPAGQEGPVGGNPYYPVWVGMPRMDISNPGIAVSTSVVEDSGLSEPYGPGTAAAEHLETNVWVKHQSQNVCWIRIDKEMGSIEFFDQDSAAVIRVDRGGHTQLFVTSLDVVASEDIRLKAGHNIHLKAGNDIFLEAGNRIGEQAGGDIGVSAGGNIDTVAAGSIGSASGGTTGFVSGGDFGVSSGGSTAFDTAGTSTTVAGGGVSTVSGGMVSQLGAAHARDGGIISDNSGLAQGPLSAPPAPLGTNASVMADEKVSDDDVEARAAALAAISAGLMGEAEAVKASGQSVLEKIKNWAAALVGAAI